MFLDNLRQHKFFFIISIFIYSVPVLLVYTNRFNYGHVIFLFFFLSLLLSFFIKENTLFDYIKLSFLYALVYGLILGIEFNFFIYLTDNEFRLNFTDWNPGFIIMNLLLILIFNVLPIFLGNVFGIIPKGIIEILTKTSRQ